MTSVAPAHRAAPQMTQTPDLAATSQAQAVTPAADAPAARPRLRDQIAESPLLSLFGGVLIALLTIQGTVMVALLVFSLTSLSDRIDGLELSLIERIDGVEARLIERIDGVEARLIERIDGVEARLIERIDAVEAKVEGLEAKMDVGFAEQDAQIGELDRKQTALIAHLNATEAVGAALEHRLLIPGAGAPEPGGEPPG